MVPGPSLVSLIRFFPPSAYVFLSTHVTNCFFPPSAYVSLRTHPNGRRQKKSLRDFFWRKNNFLTPRSSCVIKQTLTVDAKKNRSAIFFGDKKKLTPRSSCAIKKTLTVDALEVETPLPRNPPSKTAGCLTGVGLLLDSHLTFVISLFEN